MRNNEQDDVYSGRDQRKTGREAKSARGAACNGTHTTMRFFTHCASGASLFLFSHPPCVCASSLAQAAWSPCHRLASRAPRHRSARRQRPDLSPWWLTAFSLSLTELEPLRTGSGSRPQVRSSRPALVSAGRCRVEAVLPLLASSLLVRKRHVSGLGAHGTEDIVRNKGTLLCSQHRARQIPLIQQQPLRPRAVRQHTRHCAKSATVRAQEGSSHCT